MAESISLGENPTAVSVIIPAFNEQHAIRDQIIQIQNVLNNDQYDYEIIVVDDGSSDQTLLEAGLPEVRRLRHPENRGYGAALKTGIDTASYENILIIDADGTYPASEIPAILQKMDQADMVIGARTGAQVHTSWSRQPAKWLLRVLAQWIADQHIPDLNSGLRAFRKSVVRQYYSILSDRFSFTTTITLAYLADNYRLIYHPINYFPRIGSSKIVAWHFIDFMALIFRISMMFNPLRIFIPLALFFGGLGLLKTLYDIWSLFARSNSRGLDLFVQPVLSTSAVLLLFVGLQFLMIGMVADGVIRRIAQSSRQPIPSHGVESYEIFHVAQEQTGADERSKVA
jgi:glycosyltransferase involved in cell wall biosynthesis